MDTTENEMAQYFNSTFNVTLLHYYLISSGVNNHVYPGQSVINDNFTVVNIAKSTLKVMGTIARQLKALSQNTPQSSIIL